MEDITSKLEPLNDKVLVRVHTDGEKTAGGLFIPINTQNRYYFGTVIAVGECPDIKVKAGDIVYFDKGTQSTVEVEGQKFDLVSYYDLLLRVKE